MISAFTAFFDANVFYGARLRSLVLYLAQSKMFRARWSDQVHDEWTRNLLERRPDLKREDLEKTRQAMNRAIPDCLVNGYEPLMEGIALPDPDDRHVVAAAIMTRAHVIVTFNERDFPAPLLAPLRLQVSHPDAFLVDAFGLAPTIFADAVKADFMHYGNPPLVYENYLESLAKAGVPKIAKTLEPLGILMTSDT